MISYVAEYPFYSRKSSADDEVNETSRLELFIHLKSLRGSLDGDDDVDAPPVPRLCKR